MNVTEAIASRRSIRAFLDKPVDQAVLRRVLEKAQAAPSGGNTQPWNAVVIAGDPLARLIARVEAVIPDGLAAYSAEYPIYPSELEGRYADQRFGVGEAMYAALEIPREDRAKRMDVFRQNFRAFGAPVLMLVHTPRYMGLPQWSDIGMWLQSVLLLLREEGLDSCAQEAWAVYQKQVREVVDIPEDHIFFCGVAIGWRDAEAAVNRFPVPRVPVDQAVRWEGF
ncbi:MAG: nitroreductase [Novosphingobium sp.]|uniref:nitroreductase n=1 Tax=Novosphingobium sp. TaxID=1874826 RepID=UPI001DFB0AD4|nr:nitroreductase [Novosphingobium sp.]MCB2058342.1 nitroreductase [Novosphingobium sp.]MCP5385245.1 nitroreductase [Novosphingobium sp.]